MPESWDHPLAQSITASSLIEAFAAEFALEWNRLQASVSGDLTARKAELARIKGQLERLVDAIADGTPMAAIRDRLAAAEERRIALEAALAATPGTVPRLHPSLPGLYRQKVAALSKTLAGEDAAAAREVVRGLVDQIRLIPEDGQTRIELRGELAAILGLALSPVPNGKSPRPEAGALLAEQVKMVAGTRNHRQLNIVRVDC